MVYDLKLILLPSMTTSVQRVFSALIFAKTKLRNKMGLLDDYLITFIQRDIFFQEDEDDMTSTFMNFRKRRPDKKK